MLSRFQDIPDLEFLTPVEHAFYARNARNTGWTVRTIGYGSTQIPYLDSNARLLPSAIKFQSAINAEPSDASFITANSLSFYINETTGKLFCKAKFSDGTLNIAQVALFASPAVVAGLRFWLVASDCASVGNGNPVTTWTDRTSFGNNAVQSTSGNRPTYSATGGAGGKPGLVFDSDDYMDLGNLSAQFPTAGTLFVVIKLNGIDRYTTFCTNAGDYGWWRFADGNIYGQVFRDTRTGGLYGSMPTTGDKIMSVHSSASRWAFYINGVQVATDAADYAAGTVYRIAQNDGRTAGGTISEIIAYNSDLGIADRQYVEAYLQAKYGI